MTHRSCLVGEPAGRYVQAASGKPSARAGGAHVKAELKTKEKRLGKHKLGEGCRYIKRLSDVDPAVPTSLVVKAVAEAPKT